MELTEEQIGFIEMDLKIRGIALPEFRESMLDHVCCLIEHAESDSFEEAYQSALQKLPHHAMQDVQDTILKYEDNKRWKKRSLFSVLLLAVSIFILTSGALFKTMHWPTAGVQLMIGGILILFLCIPYVSFIIYKRRVRDLDE